MTNSVWLTADESIFVVWTYSTDSEFLTSCLVWPPATSSSDGTGSLGKGFPVIISFLATAPHSLEIWKGKIHYFLIKTDTICKKKQCNKDALSFYGHFRILSKKTDLEKKTFRNAEISVCSTQTSNRQQYLLRTEVVNYTQLLQLPTMNRNILRLNLSF